MVLALNGQAVDGQARQDGVVTNRGDDDSERVADNLKYEPDAVMGIDGEHIAVLCTVIEIK